MSVLKTVSVLTVVGVVAAVVFRHPVGVLASLAVAAFFTDKLFGGRYTPPSPHSPPLPHGYDSAGYRKPKAGDPDYDEDFGHFGAGATGPEDWK